MEASGTAGSPLDELLATLYDDFLALFQVKTTKGILLFLLFCVLCSVITVAICVGFIWIHRCRGEHDISANTTAINIKYPINHIHNTSRTELV